MLMRNEKEYHRVAAEWAVKYAGAPKRERAETSGGATAESLRKRQKKSREQEEAERIAQCVMIRHLVSHLADRTSSDTVDIMKDS